jgi:hypothetical protein
MKNRNKSLLYYIYCALGEKSGKNNKEADKIALVRLFMFLSIFVTNAFIVFNAVRTHIVPAEPRPVKCMNIGSSKVSL